MYATPRFFSSIYFFFLIHLATLDEGTMSENPKAMLKLERKLKSQHKITITFFYVFAQVFPQNVVLYEKPSIEGNVENRCRTIFTINLFVGGN
jgi:hypothetical protein